MTKGIDEELIIQSFRH